MSSRLWTSRVSANWEEKVFVQELVSPGAPSNREGEAGSAGIAVPLLNPLNSQQISENRNLHP